MGNDSPASELVRIEAALARLEALVGERRSAMGASGADDLARRHAALRQAVAAALERLDNLLANRS